MGDLDLRAIQIVTAVDKHGSFTRAAEVLDIAQASVSQRVRQLEQVLGTTLIDRKTRRATEPGRIVISHGARAVRELAVAREQIADLLGLQGGRLRLGIIQMVGFLDLASVIEEFHRDYPMIDISLTEDDAERMLSMLHGGELDLVMSNIAPQESPQPGLARVILGEESLTLVAPAGVSSEGPLQDAFVELEAKAMASFSPQSTMRATVESALEDLGVSPRVAFETNRLGMIESLIIRGLAWSIVPESVATSWSGALSRRPLAIATRRRVGLTWSVSGGLQPAPLAFRDRLQERASVA